MQNFHLLQQRSCGQKLTDHVHQSKHLSHHLASVADCSGWHSFHRQHRWVSTFLSVLCFLYKTCRQVGCVKQHQQTEQQLEQHIVINQQDAVIQSATSYKVLPHKETASRLAHGEQEEHSHYKQAKKQRRSQHQHKHVCHMSAQKVDQLLVFFCSCKHSGEKNNCFSEQCNQRVMLTTVDWLVKLLHNKSADLGQICSTRGNHVYSKYWVGVRPVHTGTLEPVQVGFTPNTVPPSPNFFYFYFPLQKRAVSRHEIIWSWDYAQCFKTHTMKISLFFLPLQVLATFLVSDELVHVCAQYASFLQLSATCQELLIYQQLHGYCYTMTCVTLVK